MTDEGVIYFKDGDLVVETDKARVYRMNDELFLELGEGHTLWALESELQDYIWQLQDLPRGDCLEIGLGLGVASRYILTFETVKHLTTVELSEDVIKVHSEIPDELRKYPMDYDPSRHRILNADGIAYAYQTRKRYDFIFIDCYDRIDEDTLPLIADMAVACSRILKPNGRMIGWLDKNTPEIYALGFEQIFTSLGQ
jgi:2-polyprenyl-3-methyl-5-hydroxy-6-metoxy-1,4-benzoquinol methylase